MFWTCHCDVILGLGREGVTWNSSRNSTTRNQISAARNLHRNQHHPPRKRKLARISIPAQNEEKSEISMRIIRQ